MISLSINKLFKYSYEMLNILMSLVIHEIKLVRLDNGGKQFKEK